MQKRKRIVAVAAAAVVAATGTGGALAEGRPGGGGPGPRHGAGHKAGFGMLQTAAAYLGLTPRALAAELRSRKSLAQVAEARGKSVQGLVDAILADAKARLDRAVAAGKIPAARAAEVLASLKARVTALVTRSAPARPAGPAKRERGGVLGAAAGYLGLTPQALFAELRAGKSLAQVAEAHGKSADGLKQAIVASVKARLDRAVTAGKLTAAQEQAFLARLADRLDELVNRTLPARKK
jgi:hypothetical protein